MDPESFLSLKTKNKTAVQSLRHSRTEGLGPDGWITVDQHACAASRQSFVSLSTGSTPSNLPTSPAVAKVSGKAGHKNISFQSPGINSAWRSVTAGWGFSRQGSHCVNRRHSLASCSLQIHPQPLGNAYASTAQLQQEV